MKNRSCWCSLVITLVPFIMLGQALPALVQAIPAKIPITGSEPTFDAKKQSASNCYAYVIQDYSRHFFPVLPDGNEAHDGCTALKRGMVTDSNKRAKIVACPAVGKVDRPVCDPGSYVVMLFLGEIDPEVGLDFHFYRQDKSGTFSHQMGGDDPSNLDAQGKTIFDPRTADRKHPDFTGSYSDLCACFCVQQGGFKK